MSKFYILAEGHMMSKIIGVYVFNSLTCADLFCSVVAFLGHSFAALLDDSVTYPVR